MTISPCPWCGQPVEFLALDGEWMPCDHCGRDCIISVDFVFDESIGQRRRVAVLEKLTGLGSTDKNTDNAE